MKPSRLTAEHPLLSSVLKSFTLQGPVESPKCRSRFIIMPRPAAIFLWEQRMNDCQGEGPLHWDIPVLVERAGRTLAWLTLKAVYLTLKVNRNPKLYYPVLGAFDPTVRPVRECIIGRVSRGVGQMMMIIPTGLISVTEYRSPPRRTDRKTPCLYEPATPGQQLQRHSRATGRMASGCRTSSIDRVQQPITLLSLLSR